MGSVINAFTEKIDIQSSETCFNQPRFSSNQNIINRFVLQECGILLGRCLIVKS